MAQRRVQVERLRPTTTTTPVARPVETYVRPPEAQVQESDLGAFVRAISPAMDTMAQVKKQEELKRVREVEKGIAAKRTLDAKLGLGKAVREANQDYMDNQDLYLTLSTEEVAERRQAIFQPYIEQAEASGDELLSTAIKGDLELANLSFFTETLDPARQDFSDNKTLEDASTEILAISRNTNVNNKESYMAGMEAIDDIVDSVHNATGISYRRLNEYLLNTYAPTATEEGRTGLYAWLNGGNKQKQDYLSTSWAVDKMKTINANLRTYDSRRLAATEDAEFSAFLQQNAVAFFESGGLNSDLLKDTFTARSGKEFSINKDDYVPIFEQWADENNIPADTRFEDFYVPMNVIPSNMKADIQNGKSIFSFGLVTDSEKAQAGFRTLQAYKALQGFGISIPSNLISEDDKRRLRIAEFYLDEAGIGLDISVAPEGALQSALAMAQGANLDIPVSTRITNDKMAQMLDDTWFSKNFSNAINIGNISQEVRDAAGIYLQAEGVTVVAAIEKAKADVVEDFLQTETSDGTVVAIRMLNTGLTKANAAQVNGYISEAGKLPEVLRIQEFAGGTGIGLFNSRNPNKLQLHVVGEDGERLQLIGEVAVSTLSNPDTIPNLIRQRINELSEQGVEVPELTISDEPVAMEETLDITRVPRLPDDFTVTKVTPVTENGEFSGDYIYSGIVDGEEVQYKSSQPPTEEVRGVPPTLLEDIPPEFGEMTVNEVINEADQAMNEDFSTAFEQTAKFAEEQMEDLKARARARMDEQPEVTEPVSMDEQVSTAFEQTAAFAEEQFDEIRSRGFRGIAVKAMKNKDGTVASNTKTKASNLLKEDEGFRSTPYKDGKDRSVGYGFYLPSLTDDEKALIKDVNNITEEEANAVLERKVEKLYDFWTDAVPNFNSFSQEAQAGLISMAYQLGAENVRNKFPAFFANLVKAAEAPFGSAERQQFLDVAAGNMLYNFDDEGNIKSKTLWHTQTSKRAKSMAALVAEG